MKRSDFFRPGENGCGVQEAGVFEDEVRNLSCNGAGGGEQGGIHLYHRKFDEVKQERQENQVISCRDASNIVRMF